MNKKEVATIIVKRRFAGHLLYFKAYFKIFILRKNHIGIIEQFSKEINQNFDKYFKGVVKR